MCHLMKFEYLIAKRYLRVKKTGNYISVIGIFLGVSCLIITLSILNGFGSLVKDMFVEFDSHIRITAKDERGMKDWQTVGEDIRALDGITGVSPFVLGKAVMTTPNSEKGAFIKGIDLGSVDEVNSIRKNIILHRGAYLKDESEREGELPGIIISRMLADRLYLTLGDTVSVMGSRTSGGIYSYPKVMRFKVDGLFSIEMTQYNNYALISLQDAQSLFVYGKNVSGVEVKTDNRDTIGITAEALREKLGENFIVKTFYDLHRTLFSSMKIERLAANIVLSLIILVAAFNIISSLIMLVMEKQREIGMLKSMGASSGNIMNIFIFEGGIISLLGIIGGASVGFLLCWLQMNYRFFPLPTDTYVIDYLPVYLQLSDVISVVVTAVVICFVSTVYPAYKAAQLYPVEALRYE